MEVKLRDADPEFATVMRRAMEQDGAAMPVGQPATAAPEVGWRQDPLSFFFRKPAALPEEQAEETHPREPETAHP